MRKIGIIPQVSWKPLLIFSGRYTYPREPDEKSQAAGLTDLKNKMEQAEFASRHLINEKMAIDSLLLKENNRMKVREIPNESKVQNVIYH